MDFGTTVWAPLNTGLTSNNITSILVNGSTLYATARNVPLFRSTNSGTNWTKIAMPVSVFNAFSVALINSKLYVGAQNGVFVSADTGTTWTGPISGFSYSVNALATAGSKIFAGSYDGLYSMPVSGGTWTLVSSKYSVTSFLPAPSVFLMATASSYNKVGGIFASTDNGTTWIERNTGLAATTVQGLAMNGNTLLAITNSHGLFSSTDKGNTWTLLTPDASSYDATLQTILVTGGKIFACSKTGYLSSTDNGTTWAPSTPGFIPQAFFAYGSKLFAGEGAGIRISTNNGTTWNPSNSGLTGYLSTNCFGAKWGKLFAGLYSEGVFVSTDSGATWTAANTGLANRRVRSFAFLSEKMYAATDNGGIFVSTNEGNTWTETNTGLSSKNVWSLETSGSALFAGTNVGVEMSVDSGKTWKKTSPWPVISNALLATGTELYAGTLANGVWRSSLSSLITAVETHNEMLPEKFSLSQNYPNPFNPTTTISYTLSPNPSPLGLGARVTLKIYDALGREVETLVNEMKEPGNYSVQWNAAKFASGIYFVRLQSGDKAQLMKMVVTK